MGTARKNNLGEEVEFSYADGTYTVSLVKQGRAFKGVSNSFEYAQLVFEAFSLRGAVVGEGEEGEKQATCPPRNPTTL